MRFTLYPGVLPPEAEAAAPDAPRTTRFTTNAAGLRGPPLPPPGVFRVLAVGGSATDCLYLDDAAKNSKTNGTLSRGMTTERKRRS